jgi:ABC-type antimicrobial peptide transport system permease subunit
LKLGAGDTMPITDQTGRPRKLKLVGTLAHSIFQSEMLMSEANFLQLFPSQGGFGTVLIEAAPADEAEVRKLLSSNLGDYAVAVDRTADRLAEYARVKNTYLSTFQILGSLGLMLGTIGLAVVLLRNLVERRAELALLTAIGFKRSARLRLVLSENVFLLVLGLLVGSGCALLGVLPSITSSGRTINFTGLGLTLGAVLLIGLGALTLAVWFGQRSITAADLRAE